MCGKPQPDSRISQMPVGGSAGSTTTTAPASTVTSEPNSGTSATPPLSGGAIAGIVTGAILALLIGVGIGRFIFNQRARRYEELGLPPQPPAARFNGQLGNRQFYGAPYTISGGLQQYKPPSAEAQELPSRPKAMKLQGQANT
ncbi:uncharacterized protein DFL_004908 [Arthrobotrys flagrans]|uniref:Uncharacterized protein n=1 Tax=Arthrobotrys flagrans TaxID=97331 RepID=A0A437A608_ARTFL|nr:hypothetical protein DFL_004908 [Arthrobotrys flagrans]